MLRSLLVLAVLGVGVLLALRGAFNALLLYLWIAYFRPETWLWSPGLYLSLKPSYLVGLFLTATSAVSGAQPVFNLRILLTWLFLAKCLLATVYSLAPDMSWPFFTDFAKSILISYFIVMHCNSVERLRLALSVLALSLCAEPAKQGIVELFTSPGRLNDNSLPHLGDNNGVAVGMLMSAPILAVLASLAKGKWERRIFGMLVIGVVYRGLSTYSRGGFLTAGAVSGVYWLRSKRKVRTLLALLIVAGLALPAMPSAFWDRMSTIEVSEEQTDTSAAGRIHFWRIAVAMANAHPWLGVGHNAFIPTYPDFDDSNGRFGKARAVHSVWFGVLADQGYPGLLLFVANLALGFAACRRAQRVSPSTPEGRAVAALGRSLETSLVAFTVGATFLTFQYVEFYWHVLAFAHATLLVAGRTSQSSPPPARERAGALVDGVAAAARAGSPAGAPRIFEESTPTGGGSQ